MLCPEQDKILLGYAVSGLLDFWHFGICVLLNLLFRCINRLIILRFGITCAHAPKSTSRNPRKTQADHLLGGLSLAYSHAHAQTRI